MKPEPECRFLNQITRLVKDPPPRPSIRAFGSRHALRPRHADRFSAVRAGNAGGVSVEDNLLRPESILRDRSGGWIRRTVRRNGVRAAVILPDYAARVSVLDFDCVSVLGRRAAIAGPVPGEEDHSVRYRLGRGQLLCSRRPARPGEKEDRSGRGDGRRWK